MSLMDAEKVPGTGAGGGRSNDTTKYVSALPCKSTQTLAAYEALPPALSATADSSVFTRTQERKREQTANIMQSTSKHPNDVKPE